MQILKVKDRIKGRKSYFYKFLINFMLTLFVPLLSILFVYLQAERTVEDQILVSNQSNLNQFFRMVNSIAQEMSESCLAVSNSEECRNYAYYSNYYEKKAPYQTLVVRDVLKNFQKEKYHDVFVYFPAEDRIISGARASLTSDFYYETYYSGQEMQQEFSELLNCESRLPSFFVLNRNSTDSFLCVAMKQPDYKEPELSYVVVIVLEQGYINRLLEDDEAGGIIMMFDQDGDVLLSNNARSMSWHLDGYDSTDTFYKKKIGSQTYMMLVKKSSTVNGYYVSAISFDYFWKRLSRMRMICGSSVLVCVLVSIFIAWRNTLRTYRPVKDVVDRLQQQAENDYNESEHTEFEFITALFEKQKDEWKALRRKLAGTENLRRDRALYDLLNGTAEAGEMEEDRLLKNGIALCSKYFMVAVVSIRMDEREEGELLPFILRNVFEELCGRAHKGYVIASDETKYMILMNLQETTDGEDMKEVLLEGADFLKQHYHISISIALSDLHEGIEEIAAAYREAEKTSGYRYLLEDRLITQYRQIAHRKLQYPAASESRLSRMITGYIKETENRRLPELFVRELMELYEINEDASMETVECFRYEIVNTINRALISVECSAEESGRMANELLAKETISLFQDELVRLLLLLCRREDAIAQENDVCRLAKRYIEEHYADPELSMNTIGEQMKLSGAYLSRIFKAKYGVSILNCIGETRIRNAKKALLETEKSIREIAEETGFLSSNVLIKNFKKQEGITPGDYRSINRGQKADFDDKA